MNIEDEALLDDMCENEKDKFIKWFEELNKIHQKTKHYGRGHLSDETGYFCWLDYFVGGDSPQDAIDEDLTYWAD